MKRSSRIGAPWVEEPEEEVRPRARRGSAAVLALVFVSGALGGTLLDQIHVHWHVLHYAHPGLAGQAWWVAPQFGVAVVLVFLLASSISKTRAHPQREVVPGAADAGIFVGAYLLTGALHRHSALVAIALLLIWSAAILVHRDRVWLVTMSLIMAVVGPVYESVLSSTGAFRYDVAPLVIRVPVWLPALYLNAGVLAASAERAIARLDGVAAERGPP